MTRWISLCFVLERLGNISTSLHSLVTESPTSKKAWREKKGEVVGLTVTLLVQAAREEGDLCVLFKKQDCPTLSGQNSLSTTLSNSVVNQLLDLKKFLEDR